MKQTLAKISLFILTTCLIVSCDAVKRVGEKEHLLTQTTITIDDKKKKNEDLNNLILQKENATLLGLPLRLHIYNLARENRDSLFEVWLDKNPKRRERLTKKLSKKQLDQLKASALGFNNWLKKTGEAPVIIDSLKNGNENPINNPDIYLNFLNIDLIIDFIKVQLSEDSSNKYVIYSNFDYNLSSIYLFLQSILNTQDYQNIKTKKSELKKVIPTNLKRIGIDFDIHKSLKTLVE